MKRLTLMRHADARFKDPGITDLERPLKRRGVNAAEAMAHRLQELELVPDLVLVSPARRAQQTAEIVARELSIPPRRVKREEALYLASPAELLKAVQGTGPRVEHLLVVAHNPGVSELMKQLVPRGAGAGLAPAALCSMLFEVKDWLDIDPQAVKDVKRESPPRRFFGLFL